MGALSFATNRRNPMPRFGIVRQYEKDTRKVLQAVIAYNDRRIREQAIATATAYLAKRNMVAR